MSLPWAVTARSSVGMEITGLPFHQGRHGLSQVSGGVRETMYSLWAKALVASSCITTGAAGLPCHYHRRIYLDCMASGGIQEAMYLPWVLVE